MINNIKMMQQNIGIIKQDFNIKTKVNYLIQNGRDMIQISFKY